MWRQKHELLDIKPQRPIDCRMLMEEKYPEMLRLNNNIGNNAREF